MTKKQPLSQKVQRQNEMLKALHQHAIILSKTKNITEIAEHTIDSMMKTLGFNFAANFIIVEDDRIKRIHGHDYNPGAPALIDYGFSLYGPGIITRAARTGETQLIPDTRKDSDFIGVDQGERVTSLLEDDLREHGISIPSGRTRAPVRSLSELDVPVKIEDNVVAVLNIEHNELNAFSKQEQELLETLASHVASAIQRIRLLEEQIQYETKLEALHMHTSKLAEAGNLQEIEDHTIDAMANTLGFSWAIFGIIEDNLLKFTIPKSLGGSGDPLDLSLDGPGLMIRAIRTGETQLIADVRKDVDYIGPHMNESTRKKLESTHSKRVERAHSQLGDRTPALSELDVPVKIDQVVVGVMCAESIELNAFTIQDQKLLETLANHVASAIQRIRLQEEQIQYEDKLETLHVLANKLSNASNIEEIVMYSKEAAESILKPDRGDWGGLGLVEVNRIVFGRGDWLPLDGPGVTVRAVNTGESQLVNDNRKDIDHVGVGMDENTWLKIPEEERKVIQQHQERGEGLSLSSIYVPVKIEDNVIGTLGGESLEVNAFTEQDQKLLETLAGHVASAIQKIRLLEANLQYEAKLEALHLHTSKLADSENIEEITDYTLEAMENTLGFTWASMDLVEDNFITIVIQSRSGLRSRTDTDPKPIDSPGITTRAVRTGETQLVNDVRKDVDYVGVFMDDNKLAKLPDDSRQFILNARKYGGEEYRSLSEIEVPVKIGQTVVAILGAESLELNAFTEQDKNLLETLANHVASAMMRFQHNKERELVQQELALERVRVEQADELSRLKNQFISTATHELRTPVTSILGFLELVLDYSSQDLPDTVRKDLNVVFRNAMRLVDMTNDLLDVQRITSGRFAVNLEQVDLVNTLNEVVEELTPLFDEKKQALVVEVPSQLSVNVDEIRISQLFINLLRNANKFTPVEGNIVVKVEPFESHVQISVKDSGIGLSEEDIEKLFKPFPGIRHGVNVSSTGLGLAICKGIVDVHLGVIWVESDGPGEGCTFIVRLPVNQ